MISKKVFLSEVCNIKTGKKDVNEGTSDGKYPFFTCAKEHTFSNTFSFDCEAILIAGNGAVGQTNYFEGKFEAYQRTYVLTEFKNINPKLLYIILKAKLMTHLSKIVLGNTIPYIKLGMLEKFEFSLPPYKKQQIIFNEINNINLKINNTIKNLKKDIINCERIYENYLTQCLLKKNKNWIELKLSDITTKIGSGATPKGGNKSYKSSGISLIRSLNVYDEGFKYDKLAFIDNIQAKKLDNVSLEKDDVLINITGASVTRCCIIPDDVLPGRVNQHVSILRCNKYILNPKLLLFILTSPYHKKKLLKTGDEGGATRQAITKKQLEEYLIHFPKSLDLQTELIEKIVNFRHQISILKSNYKDKLKNLFSLKESIINQKINRSCNE